MARNSDCAGLLLLSGACPVFPGLFGVSPLVHHVRGQKLALARVITHYMTSEQKEDLELVIRQEVSHLEGDAAKDFNDWLKREFKAPSRKNHAKTISYSGAAPGVV